MEPVVRFNGQNFHTQSGLATLRIMSRFADDVMIFLSSGPAASSAAKFFLL